MEDNFSLNNTEKNVSRIRDMEEIFDKAKEVLDSASDNPEEFLEYRVNMEKLEKYYASEEWKEDFALDEMGELPSDLKRGVLSEDGIFNLLEENREMLEKIRAKKREAVKKFKISNIDTFIPVIAMPLDLLVGVGAVSLLLPVNKTVAGYIVGVLLALFTVAFPIFLHLWVRNEITYNGEEVRIKNVFREKIIDLKDVVKVDYTFHFRSYRLGGSCIKLDFIFAFNQEDENTSYSLYDSAYGCDTTKLVKGVHTDIKLLLLYDEIIARYPEKRKKPVKEEENIL